MTNGAPRYVSYDRWDAEHQALVLRITGLEQQARALSGAESEHRALSDRISSIEQARKTEAEGGQTRRGRIWLIVVALMSGIVFPLVLTAVATLAHLRGGG